MSGHFAHLGLTAWPFSIVPRDEHCGYLAGRRQLTEDIEKLVTGLARRDTSSIHLFWSWFGAGKTHSLYYLAKKTIAADQHGAFRLYPIYTEFPKGTHSFFDLYKSALTALDRDVLAEAFLEASTSPEWSVKYRRISEGNPDLSEAFRNLIMGSSPEQSIAIRWLRGDALALSELRRLGISQRLRTDDQAVRNLVAIVQMLDMAARSLGQQGSRMVWVIDEFQRLAKSSGAVRREVNAGLHSLFNASATGLTLVLSFSGAPDPRNLPDWISPELRDRIGTTKVMILPPFQPAEALEFVKEVLAHFRIPGFKGPSPYFPFDRDACAYILERLGKGGKGGKGGRVSEIRPRAIMQAMHAVLDAADMEIESGKMKTIDRAFAEKVLAEYVMVSDAEPDDD